MRIALVILVLLLIPAFAVVMEWHYVQVQQPELQNTLHEELVRAGLRGVDGYIDHFDVRLKGVSTDPTGRDRAEQIVHRLSPAMRILPKTNLIETPARITAKFDGLNLRLAGLVDNAESLKAIVSAASAFHPEMTVTATDVQFSEHVQMGVIEPIDNLKLPSAVTEFLKSIRAPSSLSVIPENGVYRLRGYLPSEDLRSKVIAAIQAKPWEWLVEASKLYANPHVEPAVFTDEYTLPAFLKSFFNTPAPGSFEIDKRHGPRLTAHATPAMEDEWRKLLLPLRGALPAEMTITHVPSPFHFPGYQPESIDDPQMIARLRTIFALQRIMFDSGSNRLLPSEEVKLGPIVAAINASPPEARFIVAGYDEPGGEPNGGPKGRLRLARADAVRARLILLGARRTALDSMGFEAPTPAEPNNPDSRRECRRVELLVR